MIWGLWLSLAWAQADAEVEPRCAPAQLDALPSPPDRLAVAWVGRWKQRPTGWIRVVPARDLASWVAEQRPAWTGRTLQRLGLRKRNVDPKRRFKVVIFDVSREDLCRPVVEVEAEMPIQGVPPCPSRLARPDKVTTGCGHTLDHRTGGPGFTQYAIRSRTAHAKGSCTVPLERYLEQGGR